MSSVLAEAGAHLVINSRDEEKGNKLVNQIIGNGGSAELAIFDVNNLEEINNFFNKFNYPSLDILINNAYQGNAGNIETATSQNYLDSFQTTVVAVHNIFTRALPYLRQSVRINGQSSVINISTMYALVSPDQRIYSNVSDINPPFYGAAKAGLLQWTRYAACEFGKEGIRINSVSPGPFPSHSSQENEPELIKKIIEKVPLGRIGNINEIKGPILFLASPASSYVNGANLVVDGGWTCW